ncbi:MAG: polyprenyl synthetase family protein [Peptostreptococcus sp.]|uniref:polyprenyl synthetase family protein n=1 Tax=Peptostreptococcus sp. TaxID=1262 RepID=UPI002FC931D2
MDFISELKEKSKYIDLKLEEYMPKETGYQKTVFEAMNYSLRAGGKRLRPVLLMESYRLCGGKDEAFIPFSIAIEMIHTYSLIHDDLPAIDNDDLRRGKATNHKVFGEAMSILAGDALLSHSFEIMLGESIVSKYPNRGLNASYEISKGAGIYGMIAGQVVDVESEGEHIDREKLDFIHMNKTAKMIIASMRAGAMLAGAEADKLDAVSVYGERIGLAFQIVDDILDVVGDEKTLGKHVGSDIENEKSTYPAIFGIDKSWEIARKLISQAKEKLDIFDSEDSLFLSNLSDYIINREY